MLTFYLLEYRSVRNKNNNNNTRLYPYEHTVFNHAIGVLFMQPVTTSCSCHPPPPPLMSKVLHLNENMNDAPIRIVGHALVEQLFLLELCVIFFCFTLNVTVWKVDVGLVTVVFFLFRIKTGTVTTLSLIQSTRLLPDVAFLSHFPNCPCPEWHTWALNCINWIENLDLQLCVLVLLFYYNYCYYYYH